MTTSSADLRNQVVAQLKDRIKSRDQASIAKLISQLIDKELDNPDIWVDFIKHLPEQNSFLSSVKSQANARRSAQIAYRTQTSHNPSNVKAWLALIDLESVEATKRVLAKEAHTKLPDNLELLSGLEQRKIPFSLSNEAIKSLIRQGMAAHKDGDQKRAYSIFSKITNGDPTNVLGWLWVGKLGQTIDERKAALEQALKLDPSNTIARQAIEKLKQEADDLKFLTVAARDVRDGKFAEARKVLRVIARSQPKNIDLWLWLSIAETGEARQKALATYAAFDLPDEHLHILTVLNLQNSILGTTSMLRATLSRRHSLGVERWLAALSRDPIEIEQLLGVIVEQKDLDDNIDLMGIRILQTARAEERDSVFARVTEQHPKEVSAWLWRAAFALGTDTWLNALSKAYNLEYEYLKNNAGLDMIGGDPFETIFNTFFKPSTSTNAGTGTKPPSLRSSSELFRLFDAASKEEAAQKKAAEQEVAEQVPSEPDLTESSLEDVDPTSEESSSLFGEGTPTVSEAKTEHGSFADVEQSPEESLTTEGAAAANTSETRAEPVAVSELTARPTTLLVQQANRRAKHKPLTIEVGVQTITVRYGERTYQGPNHIDRHALLEAALDHRRYGELLFSAIFTSNPAGDGPLESSTLAAFAEAQTGGDGDTPLALNLDASAPGLHGLRWELMRPPGERPLAVREHAPFYRRIYTPHQTSRVPARPLKILIGIASPRSLGQPGNSLLEGLVPIDTAQERDIIIASLTRLRASGLVEYRLLDGEEGPPATLDGLREALQEGYHIVHIVAHGLFIEGEHLLVLETHSRGHRFVPAEQIASAILSCSEQPRLLLLMSCQSALGSQGHVLGGIGSQLVSRGIHAVLAMQDRIPVLAAQLFTQHFYDDLARSGRIDAAVAASRLALSMQPGLAAATWAIPVLMMGSDEGHCFDVDEAAGVKAPPLAPQLRSYQELAGRGDPRGQMLSSAIAEGARRAGAEERVIQELRIAVTSPISLKPPPTIGVPLTPTQDHAALTSRLKHTFSVLPQELQHFVESEGSRLSLPEELYTTIATALTVGKHVILVGPPGMGKTSLADDICAFACRRGLSTDTLFVTANAEWQIYDLIGQWMQSDDKQLYYRLGFVVEAIRSGQWLRLDEFNRAQVDKALGALVTLLANGQSDMNVEVGGHPLRLLPMRDNSLETWAAGATSGYDYVVHPHWRIIGTMNLSSKELYQLSDAVKRRFAMIEVDLPLDYPSLVTRWIDEVLGSERNSAEQHIVARVNELVGTSSDLMQLRPLSPAFVRDIVRHAAMAVRSYRQSPDLETVDVLICEAFNTYALPQLGGLESRAALRLYGYLTRFMLGEVAGSRLEKKVEQLQRRFREHYRHISNLDEWRHALSPRSSQ